jgi:hypothetical protein
MDFRLAYYPACIVTSRLVLSQWAVIPTRVLATHGRKLILESDAVFAFASEYEGGRPPHRAALSARSARVSSAGKRPDDLRLAAYSENSAVLDEQHGMACGLTQMNDGLQRERGGRDGKSGL